MRVTIIFTGKTREPYLETGIGEYLSRVKKYVPLKVVTVPDLKVSAKHTIEQVKALEGPKILQHIKPGDFVILLDEKGKMYSSVDFAGYLAGLEGRTGHVVFVTGGAYGFSREVYDRADALVSLSAMTFSHQMVRLFFTEQLYRVFTIQRGEPYHHN